MTVKTKTQKQANISHLEQQSLDQSLVQSVLTRDSIKTANFSIEELEFCDRVPDALLDNAKALLESLQALRDHVRLPIRIIPGGGFRSEATNAKVGGAKASKHMLCQASDIRITGLSPHEIASTIEQLIDAGKMKQGGLGIYSNFVHYDIRGDKARWNG